MDSNDFKKIAEEVGKVIDDNVMPVLNEHTKILGEHTKILGEHTKDLKRLKRIITTLPNKDYLDRKLAELKGDLIVLLRAEDKKLNFVIKVLKKKNLLDKEDLKELNQLEVFPTITPF